VFCVAMVTRDILYMYQGECTVRIYIYIYIYIFTHANHEIWSSPRNVTKHFFYKFSILHWPYSQYILHLRRIIFLLPEPSRCTHTHTHTHTHTPHTPPHTHKHTHTHTYIYIYFSRSYKERARQIIWLHLQLKRKWRYLEVLLQKSQSLFTGKTV